ncbi:hypothetical protein PVMG_06230, partial [Plasmodium vivax Mauritania I]
YNAARLFSVYEPILSSSYTGNSSPNNTWCDSSVKIFEKFEDRNKKNICETSIKYLEQIKKNQDNNYISNGCKYLYYKLYETVYNNSEYSDITYEFYKKLLKEYISKETNTFEDNTEKINDNIFGKLKNLDELYDNFNKYKKSEECNIGSCGCAQKCAEIYKTYQRECSRNYNTPFCVELQKFGENFNEDIRGNVDCNQKIKELQLFNKYNSIIVIIGSGVVLAFIVFSLLILYKVS